MTICILQDFHGGLLYENLCIIKLHFCNPLRPRQNGRHFADDILKFIFLNENVSIAIQISLQFVPKGPINNILALVQIMAWRRPGDKPLSEPMMVSLLTHICVTRPQWVTGKSWLSRVVLRLCDWAEAQHAATLYQKRDDDPVRWRKKQN